MSLADRRFTGLWNRADFRGLWGVQAVSIFGSRMSALSLPLLGALALDATPAQMGLLTASGALPFPLFGLFVGVLVDRLPHRPIMVVADLGRAALLGSIPLAAVLDRLTFAHLCAASFATGIFTVLFDVAYQSFLPSLIGREQLIEGNSKLESASALAQVSGPGAAGALVQSAGAPAAIALDAVTFLVSALCLIAIRPQTPPRSVRCARRSMRAAIGDGVQMVLRQPHLRATAASAATNNLFANRCSPSSCSTRPRRSAWARARSAWASGLAVSVRSRGRRSPRRPRAGWAWAAR